MSKPKDILNSARTTGGFIVGLTSVLGWLNITPDMVGQAAYDVLYYALPVVTFAGGVLFGWGVTSMRINKTVDAATKPLQEQIDRLLNRENFALMRLRGLSLKELGIIRKFMTQGGEVLLKADDASVRKLVNAGAIRIDNATYSPPDLFPFTLDDSLRSLLVEFPDTLDRAIAEAESVKSRYSEG